MSEDLYRNAKAYILNGKYYETYALQYGLENMLSILDRYDFDDKCEKRYKIIGKYGSMERAENTLRVLFSIQGNKYLMEIKDMIFKYLTGDYSLFEKLKHIPVIDIRKAFMLLTYEEQKQILFVDYKKLEYEIGKEQGFKNLSSSDFDFAIMRY